MKLAVLTGINGIRLFTRIYDGERAYNVDHNQGWADDVYFFEETYTYLGQKNSKIRMEVQGADLTSIGGQLTGTVDTIRILNPERMVQYSEYTGLEIEAGALVELNYWVSFGSGQQKSDLINLVESQVQTHVSGSPDDPSDGYPIYIQDLYLPELIHIGPRDVVSISNYEQDGKVTVVGAPGQQIFQFYEFDAGTVFDWSDGQLRVNDLVIDAPDIEGLAISAAAGVTLIGRDRESDILSVTTGFTDPSLVNFVDGLAGDDHLLGNRGHDVLDGGRGDDRLAGNDNDDTLYGGNGADTIAAGTGDDLIIGDRLEIGLVADEAEQVFRMYQAAFGRPPETNGHAAWTQRLLEGSFTLEQVATGFVNSPEFAARFGTDTNTEQFITLLYNNVLNRGPDTAGLTAWSDRLDDEGLTRSGVVIGFSESSENRRNTAADAEDFLAARTDAIWSDDVFRVYQATFGRTPDAGGFAAWTTQMGEGHELSVMFDWFVDSAEFEVRYASAADNAAFVNRIYNNTLGRNPDPAGGSDWIDRLDNQGWSRADVLEGIAQSAEFAMRTAPNLIDWMRSLDAGDVLRGEAGDDVLVGGTYADQFVFEPQGGVDRVTDLEAWDTLVFAGFEYVSQADVRSHLLQQGADVVFSDQNTVVRFDDASLNMFTDDMITI